MSLVRRFRAALGPALVLSALPVVSLRAQEPTAPAPPVATPAPTGAVTAPVTAPVTPAETDVLQRLRESGLSREDARARLTQRGYDASLADRYFDRLEGRATAPAAVDDASIAALRGIGVLPTEIGVSGLPTAGGSASEIFGRDVFERSTSQFDPMLTGPVDPAYRFGPGDELLIVLTGDVEAAHTVTVTREGYVVIPDVGQVFVNGVTMEGLRNQLYDRLGQVYSGVRRTRATTFFDISLGRLRANQIFVIGDAVRPGAYEVSSVSTVFNALHRAGGPSDLGSFRNVIVRRGGQVVAAVDLYAYLIEGDASRDVRLDQGDIIFVPPALAHVKVQGRVRRPAIYEVRPTEGLRDVIAFAGGFDADAHVQRVQIDRVLPPAERQPGMDRIIVDVDLADLDDGSGLTVPLHSGDEVTVFATLAERRNRVELTGSVIRPGTYEFRPGMSVWDLIERADGLTGDAFRPVVHVVRTLPQGGTQLLPVSLMLSPQGLPVTDLALADGDRIIVYSADALVPRGTVRVEGLVNAPGSYPLARGMTVRDLVLAAGGFREGADVYEAEVVRLRLGADRSDTIAVRHSIVLEGMLPSPWAPALATADAGAPRGGSFQLQDGDRVFLRRLAGFVSSRTVTLQGEVLHSGPYALEVRDERLSSVFRRAGGTTEDAYLAGARLIRGGVPVAINLDQALRRRDSRQDVVLEDGDVIEVPRLDPTVLVQGAVAFESRVLFRDGRSLIEYLAQAGGELGEADLSRVSVTYPNGERATAKKMLWLTDYPSVQPGSTIFVPRKVAEDDGINWDQALTRTLSVTGTILTILLAVDRLGS